MHQFFSRITPRTGSRKSARAALWNIPCTLIAFALVLTSCQQGKSDQTLVHQKVTIEAQADVVSASAEDYNLVVSPKAMTLSSESDAMTLGFKGATSSSQVIVENEEARYADLYPQTDLRIYDKGTGEAGYDFYLKPGASPDDIKLTINKGSIPFVSPKGDLELINPGAVAYRHSAPIAWQDIDGEKSPVDIAFSVKNNEVGFDLGEYDPAYGVTIDPAIKKTGRTAKSTSSKKVTNGTGGNVRVSASTLNGIFGYPFIDSMNLCGNSDTLALIIYTNAASTLTNVGINATFSGGLQYGGFLDAVSGGTVTTVSSNLNAPRFNISRLASDTVIIINLGVATNCTGSAYNLELDFVYSYDDGTTVTACTDTETYSGGIFSAGVKTPILNFRNDPVDINIVNLGTSYCQTLQVSQDGLDAYVDSFYFTIDSIDFAKLEVVSITADGTPVPFTIDPITSQVQASVVGFMAESDITDVIVCYRAPACFSGVMSPVLYKVTQQCGGLECGGSGDQLDEIFSVNFGGAGAPRTTVQLLEGAEVCGDPARLLISVRSSQNDSANGVWEDIYLTLNSCDERFLELSDVLINGNSIPATAYGYSANGSQMFVDLSLLTVDPDDADLGLDDLNNDGQFDDLAGDDT
ncbi:MAG: hypothetical protein AB8F95_01425, partial [Bacteroidia bacterium]